MAAIFGVEAGLMTASTTELVEQIEKAGMTLSGVSPDGSLGEMVEIAGHPWFLASQFHPEFKSRPDAPSPLHLGLVRAALEHAA